MDVVVYENTSLVNPDCVRVEESAGSTFKTSTTLAAV
jgi:hypothetical protein